MVLVHKLVLVQVYRSCAEWRVVDEPEEHKTGAATAPHKLIGLVDRRVECEPVT